MSLIAPYTPTADRTNTVPGVAVTPAVADTEAAGGHDGSIPRSFLILMDAAALVVAFVAAHLLAPTVRWLLLSDWPLPVSMPSWVPLPEAGGTFPPLADDLWILVVSVPPAILLMDLLGGYSQPHEQSRTRLLATCVLSPLIAVSFLALAIFALKIGTESRVLIFTFALSSAFGLLCWRGIVRLYKLRRLVAGAYAKNVLLIGAPAAVARLTQHFTQKVPSSQYKLAGSLIVGSGVAGDPAPEPQPTHAAPLLGTVDQLGDLLIHRPIHEVVAIQSEGQRTWLPQVIEECDYFRVRLRIVPEALLAGALRDLRLVFRTRPLQLPEIVLEPPHFDSDALFIKRVVDIVASLLLLIVLSPLLVAIAVAIKVTTPRLPIFYPWRVVGLKGFAFTGYKFTTMEADADARRAELQSRNEMEGPVFKVAADPRVTPLGRFLRKYSLNELPQLWSVLKGDMSLVGPRPAFRHELDRYELWHKRKLCVKPGITCLWQVSGRNRIRNFDDWVRLDLEYIDKWSLWLDARILLRTVRAVIGGTGS